MTASSGGSSSRDRAVLAITPLLPILAVALPAGGVLLPLLAPLSVWWPFASRVRERRYGAAWCWGMVWAGLLFVGVVVAVTVAPEASAERILRGESYRREMFTWIATGVGQENDWRAFLPEHILHLSLFVAVCWISAGYLGLSLGAFLLDYMSYFVASFAAASSQPLLGLVIAWVPWSVARVMAFVLLGSLFARPLLARSLLPFRGAEWRWAAVALGGIACDLLGKTLLAPSYGEFLRGFLSTVPR